MTAHNLWEWILEGVGRVSSDKLAVVSSGGGLRFGELVSGAQGIAAALREAGIRRGDRVGIWMDKTPRCVQVVLGTLAVGAAYVPLDPRSPWQRCRTIALDCDLKGLAVDSPRYHRVSNLTEGWKPRILLVDEEVDQPTPVDRASFHHESLSQAVQRSGQDLPSASPEDMAYILYTSGSTGIPKGVVHTHASALAFTRWIVDRFAIRADDVFSSHAPFHFDLSISDLYASLGSGASVCLFNSTEGMLAPWLVRSISASRISVWYSVPSILIAMLDQGLVEDGLPTVQLLFFAGEVFPISHLRRLRRAVPQARLFNLFGPTETNVCTYYEVPADIPDDQTTPIPIGRGCEHMETFVMDDTGNEAPVDVEGTLWAKGPNLMQGYWRDATRTATMLQADPRRLPGVACCTGDRVVLQADGTYLFRGRRDHMVKIRGYRVELGDVESALAAHPDVLEAVAMPLENASSGTRLVASVLPRPGSSPTPAAVRAFSCQRLPPYMVPEEVEIRLSFPRTSTGKIDRTALRLEWRSGENT